MIADDPFNFGLRKCCDLLLGISLSVRCRVKVAQNDNVLVVEAVGWSCVIERPGNHDLFVENHQLVVQFPNTIAFSNGEQLSPVRFQVGECRSILCSLLSIECSTNRHVHVQQSNHGVVDARGF